jgi:hypothetical protein
MTLRQIFEDKIVFRTGYNQIVPLYLNPTKEELRELEDSFGPCILHSMVML